MDLSTERLILGLLAVVIAVMLAAGIVGAANVGNHHASKVSTAAQPSVGPQLLPGAVPETTTSSSVPTQQITPPIGQPGGVVATPASSNHVVSTPTTANASVAAPITTTTTTQVTCTASVSNPTPQPGQRETLSILSQDSDAAVMITVHYASGDTTYKAKTSTSGQAQVSFNVPAKERPGSVPVDVGVGASEQCQTSFTVL